MPDVEWIMNNCHMMRDNGVWGMLLSIYSDSKRKTVSKT